MGAQKGWFEELGCLTVHMFRNTWFGVWWNSASHKQGQYV